MAGFSVRRRFGMLERVGNRLIESQHLFPSRKPAIPIMVRPPAQHGRHCRQLPVLLVVILPVVGCSNGQQVTEEAIAGAKQLWSAAAIENYDLEWTVTGANNAHYHVTVRGGEVRKIELEQPDGGRVELKSPAPRYFGVDGLFLTIANELALMKTDRPFNAPKGTKVVMRFQPDSKLGYPHWYRRDVMGTSQTMTIDVLKLLPQPRGADQSKR